MTGAALKLALLCVCVLAGQHGTVAVTPTAQDGVQVQVAEDWVELAVQGSHASLQTTLKLAPTALSGVYLLPQGVDAPAALARLPGGGLALDWEQHYSRTDGAGTVLRVVAALPQAATVTQVVAYCRGPAPGCDGVLATRGGAATDGGAVAVFLFTAAPQPVAASAASRRRLRQALTTQPAPTPLPDCTLEVDGQATLFEGCQSVPVRPSLLYQLYYTLEDAPQGGTRWTGGLKVDAAAAGGEWAGFGYPQSPKAMLGSQAVIVKECSSCPSGASVDGYVLRGYDSSSNVAGSFPLTNASAAKTSDGTLVARWAVDLPDRQLDTLLSSRFSFVYAVGDTDAQGGLLAHTAAGHPFGGTEIRLINGMPVAAPAAQPAAAPTTQAPAASPPPPAAPSPPPPATEAAAAGAPAAACALQLAGGETREFAACTSVPRLGTAFDLMWSLEPPPGGAAPGVNASLRLGLRAEAGGWVAVGFPASPGRMLGSTAVILRTCPAPACPAGVEVRDYFLASRTLPGVQPPGALAVSDAAAASEGGTMQGTITVQLDSVAAADPAFPILVAAGPVDSGGVVLQHFAYGTSTSNWAAGTSGGVEGEPSNVAAMKNAHGWLMAIGWTLILVGILMARHGKGVKPPLWFHLHRAIQVLGMSCTLAAFVLIFFAVRDATGSSVSAYTTHRNLGIAAMSMGLFQVTALVLRPHPGTRLRKVWQPVHHWVGRAAAVVAVANIYEGILNVRDVGTWAVATYSVVFGLIVAAGLGLDAVKLATGRDPLATAAGGKEESGLGTPSSSEPTTDKGSEGV